MNSEKKDTITTQEDILRSNRNILSEHFDCARLGRQKGTICSEPCGTITSQISFRLKQPSINVIIRRIKKERFRRG